jgi:hypothetical protein
MQEHAAVTLNTTTAPGGGIYVHDSTFVLSNGKIHGNAAGDHGGGVETTSGAVFTMTGGEISGNKANKAGGVYVNSGSGKFTMKGGVIYGSHEDDKLSNVAIVLLLVKN